MLAEPMLAEPMLAEAMQAEVDNYIARFTTERDEHGRRLVVRSGSHQPRDLLGAAEYADDGVIQDADVGDMSRPRRRGAGRGLVVEVARWSSGRRARADHSVVTSATAARVEDSSTMALFAANAATRAWTARLLTARG
jgi:hypothetical protein